MSNANEKKLVSDNDPKKFLESYYGHHCEGYVGLFSKQTKQTLKFTSNSFDQLSEEITRRKHSEDLYVGISTQEEELPRNKRGGADTSRKSLVSFLKPILLMTRIVM